MRWTQEQLNEYEQRRRNKAGPVGPPATDTECLKRSALERLHKGKKARSLGDVGSGESGPFAVRITVYAIRPADFDGYHIKELVDGLVQAGLMGDDNWRVCPSGTVTSKKVHTEAEQRTEIEVIPLEIAEPN